MEKMNATILRPRSRAPVGDRIRYDENQPSSSRSTFTSRRLAVSPWRVAVTGESREGRDRFGVFAFWRVNVSTSWHESKRNLTKSCGPFQSRYSFLSTVLSSSRWTKMVEVLSEQREREAPSPEEGPEVGPETVQRADPQLDRGPVRDFYHGQSIFVTGGTGFVGKLLIEKLLRGCPEISCIYLLVRPKKGKDAHQRVEELFDDPIFSKLKEEQPKFRHQIVAISGDCSQPDLGMAVKDRATVMERVSIFFHVAATVRFDEKMNLAVPINIRSLRDAISLCRQMPELKSFVYVSTAYANCPQPLIEEKFYESPMDAEKLIALIECLDEKLIEEISPRLLGSWPNTYTFTKAVAESVVQKEADDLPIGVFRPAIVISTYREPLQGWIDNMYGPTGVAVGAGTGILRSIHCDEALNVDIVPADLTINALIVCAWDVANRRSRSGEIENGDIARKPRNDIPIYNYVSKGNPITFRMLKNLSEKYGLEFPTIKAIWYYSFRNNKHKAVHAFYVYFLHLLPALLFDAVTLCLGKQPRMLKIYKKIHKFMDVLNYFTTKEWKFSNDAFNATLARLTDKDRENFPCDIAQINWDLYFRTYMRGIRVHLLKDPIETLPQARVKWQRLYWCHQVLKLLLAYVILKVCWALLTALLRIFDRL